MSLVVAWIVVTGTTLIFLGPGFVLGVPDLYLGALCALAFRLDRRQLALWAIGVGFFAGVHFLESWALRPLSGLAAVLVIDQLRAWFPTRTRTNRLVVVALSLLASICVGVVAQGFATRLWTGEDILHGFITWISTLLSVPLWWLIAAPKRSVVWASPMSRY